jgi:hypothetical protein
MTELVLYDQFRSALAECVAIDEIAGIKEKAAQLEAYARVRDDADAQRQFAEIRLRACIRIGEISRDLEKAEPDKGHGAGLPISGKTKADQLAQAGISTSTANRYEELTGGKEKQLQETATIAAENYFAEQTANSEPVSMGGLKKAVTGALDQVFGKPERKQRKEIPRDTDADLLCHFLYSADHQARKHNFDPVLLAQTVMEMFVEDDLQAAREFIPLMQVFVTELEKRIP